MMSNLRGGIVKPTLYEVVIMGRGYEAAAQQLGSSPSNTVQIPFGTGPGGAGANGKRLITMNCEVASLPGTGLSTQPYRINGPVRETVYERLFSGDLTLTFRLDSEMWLRKLFTAWQDIIYKTKTGDFDYYDNYISDIEIYQYPSQQAVTQAPPPAQQQEQPKIKPIYGVRIQEVYPKSISSIELGYETRDTYNKQTVEFAYRKWEEIPADEL